MHVFLPAKILQHLAFQQLLSFQERKIFSFGAGSLGQLGLGPCRRCALEELVELVEQGISRKFRWKIRKDYVREFGYLYIYICIYI